MAEFVRVKDKETGHEFTTARVLENHEVLKKRAVDANGRPLPAKPHRPIAKKATASKTSTSSGVEPTENQNPEEGSK